MDVDVAMATIVGALTDGDHYSSMPVGPGAVQFSRPYRPRWMTVGGIAALPALGVGVVLLCQRRMESFSVMIAPRHDGCSVAFGVGAPPKVIEAMAEMLTPPEVDLDFDEWIAPDDDTFRTVVDEVVTPREPAYAPLPNERTIAEAGAGAMSPSGTVADLPQRGTSAEFPSSGMVADTPASGTIAEFPVSPTMAEPSSTPSSESSVAASAGTIAERPPSPRIDVILPSSASAAASVREAPSSPPVPEPAGWPEPRLERWSVPRLESPFDAPVPASAPGVPPSPARLPPPAPVSWAVFFDTGEISVIDGNVLVGREPTTSTPNECTVAIDDPDKSVSRNHFCIARRGDEITIEDRGSSNGTAVVRKGALIDVRVGDSTVLQADDEIIFGNRRAKLHRR